MNSNGNIRQLAPNEAPRPDEIELTKEMAERLALLNQEDRKALYNQCTEDGTKLNRKARRKLAAELRRK